MATYQFKGLEEYALKLSKLRDGSREVAGKAIYAGGKNSCRRSPQKI